MNENFDEHLRWAVNAKREIGDYFSITIEWDWKIKIYCQPSEINRHKAVGILTPLVGQLVREESCGTMDYVGENKNFYVYIAT